MLVALNLLLMMLPTQVTDSKSTPYYSVLPYWITHVFYLDFDALRKIPTLDAIFADDDAWTFILSEAKSSGLNLFTGKLFGGIRWRDVNAPDDQNPVIFHWQTNYDRLRLASYYHSRFPDQMATTTFQDTPIFQLEVPHSLKIVLFEDALSVVSTVKWHDSIVLRQSDAEGTFDLNQTLVPLVNHLISQSLFHMAFQWDLEFGIRISRFLRNLGLQESAEFLLKPLFVASAIGIRSSESDFLLEVLFSYRNEEQRIKIAEGLGRLQEESSQIQLTIRSYEGTNSDEMYSYLGLISGMNLNIDPEKQIIILSIPLSPSDLNKYLRILLESMW